MLDLGQIFRAHSGNFTQALLGHGLLFPRISNSLTQTAEKLFRPQGIFLLPDRNNGRWLFCKPSIAGVESHIYRRIPGLSGNHKKEILNRFPALDDSGHASFFYTTFHSNKEVLECSIGRAASVDRACVTPLQF